jgi:ABC-type Fe3+-siderophore transport system permease subunit
VVAALTTVSGTVQMVAPALTLDRLARQPDRLSRHLFATVGMFMVVAGGTLHRALQPSNPDPGLLAWSAAQKFGASGAVAIGVGRRILSPLAIPVAAFDLASGLICLAYRRELRRAASRP